MNVVVSGWIGLSIKEHKGMCFIWNCLMTGDSLYCNSSYKCLCIRSGNLTRIVRGHYHPRIGLENSMGRLPMYKRSRNHHVINSRPIASAHQRFRDLTRSGHALIKIIINIVYLFIFFLFFRKEFKLINWTFKYNPELHRRLFIYIYI